MRERIEGWLKEADFEFSVSKTGLEVVVVGTGRGRGKGEEDDESKDSIYMKKLYDIGSGFAVINDQVKA